MANNRTTRKIYTSVVAGIFAIVIAAFSILSNISWAVQSTTTHKPNGDVGTPNWTTGGATPGNTCTGHCDRVDEDLDGSGNGDDSGSYIQVTSPVTPHLDQFTMTDATGGQRATNIRLRAYYTRINTGAFRTPLRLNVNVGGADQTFVAQTWPGGSNGTFIWFEADFPAPGAGWTQSDIDSMQAIISHPATTSGDQIRVSTVQAQVTWDTPALDQSVSRAYANADSTTPGAALAATNTAASTAQNSSFRVRMGVKPTAVNWLTGSWGAHSNQYKLQYATKSTSACSTVSSGWTDVGSSTDIRWNDNATPADGASISSYASDPDTGGSTKVYQTYEEANPFGLAAQTDIGQTAIWDFSLQNVNATPGLYCLRIIQNDGTLLTSYTAASYAELAITGNLTVLIVDSGGTEVTSPSVAFANHSVSTTGCQTSSGTLGSSSQKIRVTNDLADNGWNVSIAATAGTTSSWQSGSDHYDFNDSGGSPAGCTDSGDADVYAGQLTVSPGSGSIAAKSGCTNTGVSLGSSTAFSQGTTDAVTLISATSSSQKFCYWDVTGIGLDQKIPASTPTGTYSVDMTITVTAL